MKIWQLSNPHDHRYARAGRAGGTWQDGEYKVRKRPIVIEWEPDSDIVGDFTWPGLVTDIVVREEVIRALKAANVPGFQSKPVEMQENSERAKLRSKRPRVQLPFTGPPLWDLWVTAWTCIDRERSTVSRVERADGSEDYQVTGVERMETAWDHERMELVERRIPRVAGAGIFVPPIRGIFRVEEVPAWVFCTDDVKRLIEEHAFTNVSFLEMGDVINDG